MIKCLGGMSWKICVGGGSFFWGGGGAGSDF